MKALKPLLALLSAVTVGVVVGVVLLARGGDDPPGTRFAEAGPDGPSARITASILPATHVFGDPVTAQADILVDPRRTDPAFVRLEAEVDPYTRVGDVERAETRAGDLVRVRYRFRLACFSTSCVPSGERREIELASGHVALAVRGPGGRSLRTQQMFAWPSFSVASRLGPFDVERARWRAATGTMPAAGYRLEPGVLAALLFGGALVLLAVAGVLLTTLGPVRLRRSRVEAVAPRRVPPLERALELARAMSRNGASGDQRRALERLSRELLAVGEPALAGRARRLAWSAERADAEQVDSLAGDVRAVRAEKTGAEP